MDSLYNTDFYAWTQEQAKLLHHHQWSQLDLPNLIEEIESLGKQQRAELRNRLGVFDWTFIEVEYQPHYRSRSWLSTIRIQRRDIKQLFKDNPSLKPYFEEALQEAYENGRNLASGETNLPLSTFPQECLYTLEDILSDRFYPGELAGDELFE